MLMNWPTSLWRLFSFTMETPGKVNKIELPLLQKQTLPDAVLLTATEKIESIKEKTWFKYKLASTTWRFNVLTLIR